MKIGIVCPYNIALGGAVQEICKEQHDEFKRRGHEVKIITPLPKQGIPENISQNMLYVGKGRDPKTPLGTVAQISYCYDVKEIDSILESEKFDILQVHEPWVPLIGRQIIERRQCPVVATFHAKLPENWAGAAIKKYGSLYTLPPLKYIDAFVYVSEPAKELISSLTDKTLYHIPNAVNLAEFKPSKTCNPLDSEKKTILYIGRLEERKGVTYLISAFKQMQKYRDDVRLVIGGSGPELEKLKQQVIDEQINDVEFIGFVEDKLKKQLMRRCDLFVAPAVFGESFGIVLIEALASGAVVVAGDNPGYRSVMKDAGQIGLVDPLDVEQFGDRMNLLLDNNQLRKTIMDWAKTYVMQFDYRTVSDAYIKIYEKLSSNGVKKKI